MLQDVGEAQLGGSLDSLGLQLLLRPELHQVLPRGLPAMPAASQLLLNRSSVGKTELCRGRRCDGAQVIALVIYTRCE